MKYIVLLMIPVLLSSCGYSEYRQKALAEKQANEVAEKGAELPKDFSYSVTKDDSNDLLEKNQLEITINNKITEPQLRTLAAKIFESKPKQKRFYIFYFLPNQNIAWATTHYDPDLKVNIIGSTNEQDSQKEKLVNAARGEIIGKWREEQYTSADYMILNESGKIIMRTIYKNGQKSDSEMKVSKTNDGEKYNYQSGGFNGEYFIISKTGELQFFNKEGNNFTTAKRIN